MPCLCRQIHMHWGQVPPGASDGLLPDPDVHTLPPHRHPVMGVLLDKHGCCTSQSGSGHHHCADHDHTELWLKSFSTQGGSGGGRGSRDQAVTWLLSEVDSLSPSVSELIKKNHRMDTLTIVLKSLFIPIHTLNNQINLCCLARPGFSCPS